MRATESESLQTVGAIIKGSRGTLKPPPVHSHPHARSRSHRPGDRHWVHTQGLTPAKRKVPTVMTLWKALSPETPILVLVPPSRSLILLCGRFLSFLPSRRYIPVRQISCVESVKTYVTQLPPSFPVSHLILQFPHLASPTLSPAFFGGGGGGRVERERERES